MKTFKITDDDLFNSKIAVYNTGVVLKNEEGKDVPFNPKKFPAKAIDIVFPVGNLLVEVYLDSNDKAWGSNIVSKDEETEVKQGAELTSGQYKQFFGSGFYKKLNAVIDKKWPTSDPFYSDLYKAVKEKTIL